MKYYCSQCKLAVIVLPEHPPIKACKCEAAIIADMQATVYSHSRLNQTEQCQQDSNDLKK